MADWIIRILFMFSVHVFVSSNDVSCNLPLGVESGAILDYQLTATTSQNVLREPRNARLHKNYGKGGWYPSVQDNKQYLTVDLMYMTTLTGVATQGAVAGGFAKEYKLEYSLDGENWELYREDSRTKIFQGNSDTIQVTKHEFRDPIQAKMIRFNPTKFTDLGMRVEVYGCYDEDGINSANFNGTTYLRYEAEGRHTIETEREYIRFRFRTDKPDGVLIHAFGTSGDYLLFQILKSKLVVTLNLGSSHVSDGNSWIECGNLLDDSQWHLVLFKRSHHHMTLTVDGVSVSNYTNGQYKILNINERLYIGGTEFKTRKELLTDEMFVGCIQRLLMSNSLEESSLATALDFITEAERGVKPQLTVVGDITYDCRGKSSTPVTFPEKESFFRLLRSERASNSFRVQFQFRTFEEDSYMVYNRLVQSGGGRIIVGLQDSSLVVMIKYQTFPVVVPAGNNLNDGLWHHILVEVTSSVIRVSIDGALTIVNRDLFFTGSEFYYFGGTGTLSGEETFHLPGFRGCMKDIHIDDQRLDLEHSSSDSIPIVESEGVEVGSCALEDWCSPNPCEHGGRCIPEWETFTCLCQGGYTGSTCHSSRRDQSCADSGGSGAYIIDPDGSGPMEEVTVECEIDGDLVWTVIGHDTEAEGAVTPGHESPGSYTRDIIYHDITMEHIAYIVDHSEHCEQFVEYTCNSAKLMNSPAGDPYGWWVDRHGDQVYSWGDAYVNSRKCACGMTRTCSDPNKYCNCDADTTSQLTDEGLLTDKNLLPVTRLQFGDVGPGQSASYKLGKIRCRGDATVHNVVTFRSAGASLGVPVQLTPEGALDVTFQFKTTSERAVLISAEGQDETFFQVELHGSSQIILRFDFGGLESTVEHPSDEPLNDNQWHSVKMNLDKKELTLQVEEDTKTEMLHNGHRGFVIQSDLFIGATPLQTEGFVGCIRKLQINGEVFNLRKAALLAQEVVAGCSGQCSVEPCLFGGRCMEGYNNFTCDCTPTPAEGEYCSKEVGGEMGLSSSIDYSLPVALRQPSEVDNITLGFTTSSATGVLFRIQNEGSRYQQISLESGGLVYKYKLEEGPERSLKVNQHSFGDDRHHFVNVVRRTTEVTLKVDDYPIQKDDISAQSFTPSRLIVGAASSGGQNFQGCISRVHFNSSSVSISPLKLYFSADRPSGLQGQGSITQSRCRVLNTPPPLLSKEPPVYSPTETPPGDRVKAGSVLAPGDKATIAIIIIVLLLAFIVLAFLVTRYMHRHKGHYITNEARGCEFAQDPDMALMLSDPRHTLEKKREYYF